MGLSVGGGEYFGGRKLVGFEFWGVPPLTWSLEELAARSGMPGPVFCPSPGLLPTPVLCWPYTY